MILSSPQCLQCLAIIPLGAAIAMPMLFLKWPYTALPARTYIIAFMSFLDRYVS